MRKHLPPFILLFISYTPIEASLQQPAFSSQFTANTYFGQDFNILDTENNFDPYSVFQYIYDFGIQHRKEPSEDKKRTVDLSLQARIKGIFGNTGSGIVPLQQLSKFDFWVREFCITYAPTENKDSVIKMGLFPFKIGYGLVLGNAYDISIPISWQYEYLQINEFRPGLLLQLANQAGTITAQNYLGFVANQNNLQNPTTNPTSGIVSAGLQGTDDTIASNENKGNIVAGFQLNLSKLRDKRLSISPYVAFQRARQSLEAPHDAESKLYTPGFCGSYERANWKVRFECARNFGHQKVNELDRNQIVHGLNTELFYLPIPNTPLANAVQGNFIQSDIVIPEVLGEIYGNGTTFLYTPTGNEPSFAFKNSYNRIRHAYKNTYAGLFLYLDFILEKDNLRWSLAGSYASGDDTPNDSPHTLLMTRLIPGVQYKDYDKKYKGFIGTNQMPEINGINAMYFGPGVFTYTNRAVLGSTLSYSTQAEHNRLSTEITVAGYFKPTAPQLGIFNASGVNTAEPLPHYLGTELNWVATYALGSHFSFTLQTALFFSGRFCKQLKQQAETIAEQLAAQLTEPSPTPLQTTPPSNTLNHCFFAGFTLTWLFDSNDIQQFFDRRRS